MLTQQLFVRGAPAVETVLLPVSQQRGISRMMLQSYDWEGALENCREILSADPDHLGALEVLAQAQWYAGEYDSVIQTTSKLLRLNPHEPGYRYTRGMAFLSRGDLLRSAEDFRTAMSQSENPAFQSQVSEALDAVEMWIEEKSLRPEIRASKSPHPGLTSNDRSAYRFH